MGLPKEAASWRMPQIWFSVGRAAEVRNFVAQLEQEKDYIPRFQVVTQGSGTEGKLPGCFSRLFGAN
jgi:hypothetical protein